MSETTNSKTAEELIAEYEQSESDVSTALDNLAKAQQTRDEKKAEIEAKFEELKTKFSGIDEKIDEAIDNVSEKVDEKLDEAKDEWAELAQTDPDEARRKLRTFWIAIAVVTFVAGVGLGFILF